MLPTGDQFVKCISVIIKLRYYGTMNVAHRVTSRPCLPGTVSILALKIQCPRKPLGPRQSGLVGPSEWNIGLRR